MKTSEYFAAVAAQESAHDNTIPAGQGSPIENLTAANAAENSAAANQTEPGAGLPTITPAPTPSIVEAIVEVPKVAVQEAETEVQKLEKRITELEHQFQLYLASEYHSLLSSAAGFIKKVFAEL